MFDPVTIILVLLLVLVTILYFTKKPKDRVELKLLNSNFKEVNLPLSSPDGKFKLQYEEETKDGVKLTSPIFRYEGITTPGKTSIVINFEENSSLEEYLKKKNNISLKYFEYYNDNIYQILQILNDNVIFGLTPNIPSTTMPKLSLTNDKKFVISNITYPGVSNEIPFDIIF